MIPCSKKSVNVAQLAWAGVLVFMVIPGFSSLNSVAYGNNQCLLAHEQGCMCRMELRRHLP